MNPKLNPKSKRFLVALGAGLFAFSAALGAIEGGETMTVSDIGRIPLMSWAAVLGAMVMGYLNGENIGVKKQ